MRQAQCVVPFHSKYVKQENKNKGLKERNGRTEQRECMNGPK